MKSRSIETQAFLRAGTLACALGGALGFTSIAQGAGPSTAFGVTGAVSLPTVYDSARLEALPAITQTVSFTAGGAPQTHIFTGASFWGIVDAAGVVNNPAVENDGLNKYVLATGSDGYKVVFALGELNPSFGNRPDLAAYAETVNGVATPLGADGFARTTSPGDVRGGRYVSNLIDLDVRSSASTVAASGGGISIRFTVSGSVLRPGTFDAASLQTIPSTTETVDGIVYTGVSFWNLLNSTVGISTSAAVKNDVLGKYVVATGSDGYKSVFSLGELSPDFGNQPDLIAYDADGAGLGSSGFARIVAPNDVKHGRWVSNLVSLEVLSAAPVPEPATHALMWLGLALVGWRAAKRRAGVLAARTASA